MTKDYDFRNCDMYQNAMCKIASKLWDGGGLSSWHIETKGKGKYIRLYNSYHVMSDTGMYIGWQDFIILLDRATFDNLVWTIAVCDMLDDHTHNELIHKLIYMLRDSFKFQFSGDRYLGRYYALKEFLDEDFAYNLATIAKDYE